MALHADIIAANGIEAARIYDVACRGVRDVLASRAVAFFATYIPLGDLAGGEVVIDGVAAIACGAGGAVGVGFAIVRRPPIRVIRNVIGEPTTVHDVPLRRKRVIVDAALFEVTLLPPAAVNEGDLVERKGAKRVGMSEVAENNIGMDFGVAYDVGHPGLMPTVVLLFVAGFAGRGAHEGSALGGGGFLRVQAVCGSEADEGHETDAHEFPLRGKHIASQRRHCHQKVRGLEERSGVA